VDLKSVIKHISNADIPLLGITVLISFIIMIFRAQRWRLILAESGLKLTFYRSFQLSMAALPFWIIAPATSGDLVKGLFLKNELNISKTIGTVACENILDLLNLLIFSLIGLAFFFEPIRFITVIILSIVVMGIFLLSTLNIKPKLIMKYKLLDKINNMMKSMRLNRKTFFFASILTLASWILSMLQIYILFFAVGITIPLLFAFANIPLAILIGMIPIALGGIGTRDAAIILLFKEFANPESLLGVGILFTVVRQVILGIIGAFFLMTLKKNWQQIIRRNKEI
jgi:uncharacterized protein (TIRG00374 family)